MLNSRSSTNKIQIDDTEFYGYSTATAYLCCFAACLFSFYDIFQFSLFNSIGPEILTSLNLNTTQLGILSSYNLFANAIGLIPAGLILDRFSVRKTALSFMVLAVSSSFIIALSNSFNLDCVARVLQGFASAISLLTITRITTIWFPHNKASAMSISIALALCGGLFGNYGLMIIIHHYGWRHSMIISALIGLIFLIFMWLFLQEKTPNSELKHAIQKPSFTQLTLITDILHIKNKLQLIMIGLYIGFMNLPVFIFASLWGNIYLTGFYGFNPLTASLISTLLFIGTMIGLPIAGILSDQLHNRKLLMVLGALFSLIILILISFGYFQHVISIALLFFLLGIFTSLQIIGFALIADIYPIQQRSFATSIAAFLENICGAISQTLYGWMLNYHSKPFMTSTFYASIADANPDLNYHFATILLIVSFVFSLLLSCKIKNTTSY